MGRAVAEVIIHEDQEVHEPGRWLPLRICLLHGGSEVLNGLKRRAAECAGTVAEKGSAGKP